MIIEFTVRNYLSFKEEASISFVATSASKKQNADSLVDIENGKFSILPFAAIYGANASGKSNLLRGLSDFVAFIRNSHNYGIDTPIPAYRPFKLDTRSRTEPVSFTIEFLLEGVRYNYSIEFVKDRIIVESLYFFPEGRRAILFVREGNLPIVYGNYYKGIKKGIQKLLLDNSLLVSRVANLFQDENALTAVYRYFRDTYHFHFDMDSGAVPVFNTTVQISNSDPTFKQRVLSLLNAADFNVSDITVVEDKSVLGQLQFPANIPEDVKAKIVADFTKKALLSHPIYEGDRIVSEAKFDLTQEESSGTVKIYDLAGLIINTLLTGGILVIDEFNSGLHPYITQYVTQMFTDKVMNRKNAQLFVTTHDTYILDSESVERDQIWFTEKSDFGISRIYSLDEFDKNVVRKNVRFGKWYLDGRFRGVPRVNSRQMELW